MQETPVHLSCKYWRAIALRRRSPGANAGRRGPVCIFEEGAQRHKPWLQTLIEFLPLSIYVLPGTPERRQMPAFGK
jgi:hypothetical protein